MSGLVLYHGSKSGINGPILPKSRKHCDFGQGFYMGTEERQPLTLICGYEDAKLYKLNLSLEGLQILELDIGLDWALTIAYNRGRMKDIEGTTLYNKYRDMAENIDVMAGYTANDRMFFVLDRFFSGEITDQALIHSLSALKLGRQYVALTEKACLNITIMEERCLDQNMKNRMLEESEQNRREGREKADEVCRRYRREGMYFDEIIKGGSGHGAADR